MFESRSGTFPAARGRRPGVSGVRLEMSKRYRDPIEVEAPEGGIEAFWWRGKRYQVREVICRWRETGDWWRDTEQRPWAAGESREMYRIDTAPTTNGLAAGVYEIARDLRSGAWTLFRVLD
jgi:hypothetical protein